MTTYVSTESYVYHIEPDKFIGGNLLFADLSSMKTTDGNTNNIIAGVAMTSGYVEGIGSLARFTRISSFLQMNASQVLVVDTNSHCLRSVDRTTGTTSTFLGVCTKAGYANDARKLSLFRNPWSVMHNSMNIEEYIVSDWNNNALRVYDTKTEVVTTLVKAPPLQVEFYPSGMGQNSKTGDVYISSTYTHAVFHFSYATKALSLVAGTGSYGFSEGPFLSAKFEYPYGLLLIDGRQKLLVADEDNGRIRILDLDANTTASVCDGAKTTVDGNLQRCSVRYPYSLLVIGDTLFIGGLRKIRKIKGKNNLDNKAICKSFQDLLQLKIIFYNCKNVEYRTVGSRVLFSNSMKKQNILITQTFLCFNFFRISLARISGTLYHSPLQPKLWASFRQADF